MSETVLAAQHLSAGYGDLAAVRDVSLELHAGEVVALLGANGAGKTTTLLTLAGILPPMSGAVCWKGAPTSAPLHLRARQGLALVTDDRSVFMTLTVAENLRLGRGDIESALAIFPELEKHLKRHAGLLSGGQQQMLTLGRALASKPDALLVDELSLGLAPVLVGHLLEALRRAAETGIAVLLVEQRVRRALSIADRAYVLERGSIALTGTAEDLTSRLGELERVYLGVPADDE